MYVLFGHTDGAAWNRYDAVDLYTRDSDASEPEEIADRMNLQCLREDLKLHLENTLLVGLDEITESDLEQIQSILDAMTTAFVGNASTFVYEEPHSTGTVAWGFTVTRFRYA